MKIIINTASTFEGGAIQVAASFIEECKKFPENEYHIFLGIKLAPFIDINAFPKNYFFYPIGYRPAERIFSIKPRSSIFKKLEKRIKPDVVFTTSGPAYWKPSAPHLCGFNIPQSVYPESQYFKIIPKRKQYKWKIDRILRRYFFKKEGTEFVVQTEDVNSRLRLWFKTENVYTVSNTCSSHYLYPQKTTNKLPAKKPGEFRFLVFSTFRPHKNLGVIKGIIDNLPESIKKDVRFVLTIPQNNFDSMFQEYYKEFVYNAGPIKVDEGPGIYDECDASFYPTLLECFSAAYPEAMAMEKPIMTSDLSFAKSICQNAAWYFNPLDPKDIAEKLSEFLADEELRKKLIKNGLSRLKDFGSAEERAKSYLALCKKIVEKEKR